MNSTNSNTSKRSLDCGTVFDKTNYPLFIFKLTPVLEDEDLVEERLANGVVTRHLKDTPRATRAILCNVNQEVAEELQDCKSASEMMSQLHATYSGANRPRMLRGLKQIANFKCAGGNIRKDIEDIKRLIRETVVANDGATIKI